MFRRILSGLAALGAGLLAACDDATVITHVDRLSHVERSDLVTMQSQGGIPTEIHGLPFAGVTAEELAASLRPPAGGAQGVRFRAVAPGRGADPHSGHRLVLHFNPLGPPNSATDCRLTAPVETGPPRDKGFEVNATFCEGDRWIAHGFMKAPGVEAGDLDGFSREMRTLFVTIFRAEKDR